MPIYILQISDSQDNTEYLTYKAPVYKSGYLV